MVIAKWVALVACGLLAVSILLIVLAMILAETRDPFPVTEITHQKPYVDFVGRECRVVADVRATAWNDFPNKGKILSIALSGPPGVRNRFVSYVTPLKPARPFSSSAPGSSSDWSGSTGTTSSSFLARDCRTASQSRCT